MTLSDPLGGQGPLAIDLCCGLGGWTDGLLSEGWRVRGYDIEAHEYGDDRYPAELVLRNVLEMHGSEIADADLIVASPPCQKYSYMAMPWKRAKAQAAAIRADETGELLRDLNAIFDACLRLRREASEVAGRSIPMVLENVRGAQDWVGRAAWNFGPYYLWGDLPALMPSPHALDNVAKGVGIGSVSWGQGKGNRHPNDPRNFWSKSPARKAASAKIAKIPLALSSHIARVYRPKDLAA
jgi:hypothetical protein